MALSTNMLGKQTNDLGKLKTHVDMLIYGTWKSGKTYRTSTAPKPIYLMSPDPTGHKSYPFETPGRVIRTLKEIKDDIMEFYEGGHGYKTLVLDGLSWIHDLYVKEIGQFFVDQMGAKDADLMPIGGRMKIIKQFKAMLRAIVDLTQLENEKDRVHVIFTALEERVKEADDAPFTIRPLIGTQKMNEEYPAIFSVIGYIKPIGAMQEPKEGSTEISLDRKMLFTEYGSVKAGDRLNLFPPICEPAPNLSDYLF